MKQLIIISISLIALSGCCPNQQEKVQYESKYTREQCMEYALRVCRGTADYDWCRNWNYDFCREVETNSPLVLDVK